MPTPPPRFRVFLVDPVRSRRETLERDLRVRFDVQGYGTVAEAAEAARRLAPHGVVLGVRQVEGNGMTAAAQLRKVVGTDTFVCVVGAVDEAPSAEQRQALMKRNQVDTWLPRVVDGPSLEVLLWTELLRRAVAAEARTRPEPTPAAPAPTLLQRLRGWTGGSAVARRG